MDGFEFNLELIRTSELYTSCTGVTLNCSALDFSQSESSTFFTYIINFLFCQITSKQNSPVEVENNFSHNNSTCKSCKVRCTT